MDFGNLNLKKRKNKIVLLFLLGIILVIPLLSVEAEEMSTSVIVMVCGNEKVEGDEECDDGNTESGDGCSSTCQTEEEEEEPPPSGGGGGGAPSPTITTKVVLQGKASPGAYLTVLKDGQVLLDKQADNQADFKVEITNITPGIYTFSIWAKDKNDIKSLTFSFTMNVISGAITTVSGIFLPPTINLNKDNVKKGETLNISGQTAPQSQIEIHINSDEIIEEVIADTTGAWLYNLNTGRLEEGTHSVRAKATTPDGLLSTFSQTLLFGIDRVLGIIKEVDVNRDNRVNLIDFSILLYNWGVPKNPTADLNNDGQVDLIDFSILLYWWTG